MTRKPAHQRGPEAMNYSRPLFYKFLNAYIECALWSESACLRDENDDRSFIDVGLDEDNMHSDTIAQMRDEALEFYIEHMDRIYECESQAGHDFWLTRNGHGCGFWDGDWDEPAATLLTDASNAAGERDLYIGDNGLVYIFPHRG